MELSNGITDVNATVDITSLQPIPLDSVVAKSILANEDILVPAVYIAANCTIRVSICPSASCALILRLTRGGVIQSMYLNRGQLLEAGCLYSFDLPSRIGDRINFRVDASQTLGFLNVDAILAGA